MSRFFSKVCLFEQRICHGSVLVPAAGLPIASFRHYHGDFRRLMYTEGIVAPLYNLAVASDATLKPPHHLSLFQGIGIPTEVEKQLGEANRAAAEARGPLPQREEQLRRRTEHYQTTVVKDYESFLGRQRAEYEAILVRMRRENEAACTKPAPTLSVSKRDGLPSSAPSWTKSPALAPGGWHARCAGSRAFFALHSAWASADVLPREESARGTSKFFVPTPWRLRACRAVLYSTPAASCGR